MGRMAARALAKAVIAGVAAFAGLTCMAQEPGHTQALPSPMVPARAGPEFRANRPIQLTPVADGPTRDAPLSFGRSRPADRVEPPSVVTLTPSPSPSPSPKAVAATAPPPRPAIEGSRASARASADPATGPTAAALAAGLVPPGSGRIGEAQALERLRARLEATLARHATLDARISVDRKALRVAARGADSSATPQPVATDANLAVRRKPATTPSRRAERRSSERKAGPRDWNYSGDTGPAHWATLNPQWAACGAATPQSPIDIRDGIAVGLPAIEFDLAPAILTIRDDGRAIRAVVREGPAIGTLGRRFELREISFHQPAEFRIDGKAFDLSAHLLHRDEQGRPAIVVVLFEIGDEASARNPVVQTVLDYLPLSRDMLMPVAGRTDLGALLPADRGYYNFVGSLSSPPCTEGVIWMVMREPLRVPPSQAAIFARVHPMNVRPLQPLAGRLIKQSE